VANSGGVIAAFVVVTVLFVGYIGVLMAVAVPAYNQYVERAQAASEMQYDYDY
jgi:Tfp pilus assembly protein PilE